MLTKERTNDDSQEIQNSDENVSVKEYLSENKKSFKKNIVFYILVILFLFGMIYGVLLSKYNFNSFFDNIFFNSEIKNIASEVKNPLKISLNSLFINLIYFAVAYFFGYCAIGQGISLFLPLFKGLGIGLTITNIYLTYTLKGILYCAVIIIPQTSIALLAILIACRESVQFSNVFFRSFSSKNTTKMSKEAIKLYNIKFLILLGIIVVSFIVDYVLRLLFQNIFLLS